jgi:hypothetical protein
MSEKRGFGQVLLSLFTLLVTVIGAGVAFVEYRGAQQRERVERVFRYSDQLASESDANGRITELSDEFYVAWSNGLAASLGENPTEQQLKDVANKWYVDRIDNDRELRATIERMSVFYDTLSVCVSEGLCDEPAARALFSEQVAAFASTVYPWIAHRHTGFLDAAGIRTLCLRNRFCGGETVCDGLPEKLASCN